MSRFWLFWCICYSHVLLLIVLVYLLQPCLAFDCSGVFVTAMSRFWLFWCICYSHVLLLIVLVYLLQPCLAFDCSGVFVTAMSRFWLFWCIFTAMSRFWLFWCICYSHVLLLIVLVYLLHGHVSLLIVLVYFYSHVSLLIVLVYLLQPCLAFDCSGVFLQPWLAFDCAGVFVTVMSRFWLFWCICYSHVLLLIVLVYFYSHVLLWLCWCICYSHVLLWLCWCICYSHVSLLIVLVYLLQSCLAFDCSGVFVTAMSRFWLFWCICYSHVLLLIVLVYFYSHVLLWLCWCVFWSHVLLLIALLYLLQLCPAFDCPGDASPPCSYDDFLDTCFQTLEGNVCYGCRVCRQELDRTPPPPDRVPCPGEEDTESSDELDQSTSSEKTRDKRDQSAAGQQENGSFLLRRLLYQTRRKATSWIIHQGLTKKYSKHDKHGHCVGDCVSHTLKQSIEIRITIMLLDEWRAQNFWSVARVTLLILSLNGYWYPGCHMDIWVSD